jgi:acetyl-CoA/propionyl-CoA carboxylase, biotin carboxylase, biotin carboxyl carrier protein
MDWPRRADVDRPELEPANASADGSLGTDGPVLSPRPGTVTLVRVTEGQIVTAGQLLVVVEATKMEQILSAPADGVVRSLRARPGDAVAKDAVLLVIEASGTDHEESR